MTGITASSSRVAYALFSNLLDRGQAVDQTITEQDLDQDSLDYLQSLGNNAGSEPDLAIDGLTDSLLSRLLRLFSFGRS